MPQYFAHGKKEKKKRVCLRVHTHVNYTSHLYLWTQDTHLPCPAICCRLPGSSEAVGCSRQWLFTKIINTKSRSHSKHLKKITKSGIKLKQREAKMEEMGEKWRESKYIWSNKQQNRKQSVRVRLKCKKRRRNPRETSISRKRKCVNKSEWRDEKKSESCSWGEVLIKDLWSPRSPRSTWGTFTVIVKLSPWMHANNKLAFSHDAMKKTSGALKASARWHSRATFLHWKEEQQDCCAESREKL